MLTGSKMTMRSCWRWRLRWSAPVWLHEALLVAGTTNHIDPDARRPPDRMSFTEFYGLGERVHRSRLAKVYRPAHTQIAVDEPDNGAGGPDETDAA